MGRIVLPVGVAEASFELKSGTVDGFEPLKVGTRVKYGKGWRKGKVQQIVGVTEAGVLCTFDEESGLAAVPWDGVRSFVEANSLEVLPAGDEISGVSFLSELRRRTMKQTADASDLSLSWVRVEVPHPTIPSPVALVDTDDNASEFWTGFAPNDCKLLTKGALTGLILRYLGLADRVAVFDVVGWLVSMLPQKSDTLQWAPSLTRDRSDVKLKLALGSATQSGIGDNVVRFCDAFGVRSFEGGPTRPEDRRDVWQDVAFGLDGGRLEPESVRQAAQRLWVATHEWRQL
ncbi:hypothetical protein DIPPA_35217 [Diplonema papillatum]|nr:hypothetical protein DIPPA_35217 [Diplonema papillatum]